MQIHDNLRGRKHSLIDLYNFIIVPFSQGLHEKKKSILVDKISLNHES